MGIRASCSLRKRSANLALHHMFFPSRYQHGVLLLILRSGDPGNSCADIIGSRSDFPRINLRSWVYYMLGGSSRFTPCWPGSWTRMTFYTPYSTTFSIRCRPPSPEFLSTAFLDLTGLIHVTIHTCSRRHDLVRLPLLSGHTMQPSIISWEARHAITSCCWQANDWQRGIFDPPSGVDPFFSSTSSCFTRIAG